MLRQLLAIAFKDLLVLARDRTAVVLLFIMPVVFILVMTPALQGTFGGDVKHNPARLLWVDEDKGAIGAAILADLRSLPGLEVIDHGDDGVPLSRSAAEVLIADGEHRAALVLPAGFSAQVTDPAGEPAEVLLIADPATSDQWLAPVRGMIQGYIERRAAVARVRARLQRQISQAVARTAPSQAPATRQLGDALVKPLAGDSPSAISVAIQAPASLRMGARPTSAQQNVPGYTIFGVFFIVHALAVSILREKQDGTFRRLLLAPLSRTALLLGKLVPFYAITLIQIALMFTVGVLVFGLQLGHSVAALVLLSLAVSASATSLGLLVAAMGRTAEQISGISLLLVTTLAALGGTMVPTYLMPGFMQVLAKASPHAWALEGYQDVLVRGLGVAAILPEMSVLWTFTALFLAVALWRFRFD